MYLTEKKEAVWFFIIINICFLVNAFASVGRVPLVLLTSICMFCYCFYRGLTYKLLLFIILLYIPCVIVLVINPRLITYGSLLINFITFSSFFSMSFILSKNDKIAYLLSRYLIVGYLIFLSFVLVYGVVFVGKPFSDYSNHLFFDASRNVVQQYLLFYLGFYIFTSLLFGCKISNVIIFCSLFFALMSGSRTALILITLLSLVVFNIQGSISSKVFVFILLLCLIFFLYDNLLLDVN